MLAWKVKAQKREKGLYYVATYQAENLPRSVTLGHLTWRDSYEVALSVWPTRWSDTGAEITDFDEYDPAYLTQLDELGALYSRDSQPPSVGLIGARLIAYADAKDLPVEELRLLVTAPTVAQYEEELAKDPVRRSARHKRESRVLAVVGEDGEVTPRRKVAVHPKGTMTLREYVRSVWLPHRAAAVAAKTLKDETWMWEHRMLPVLGDYRLCDLDAFAWNDFMANLRGLPNGPCPGKPLAVRTRLLMRMWYKAAMTYAAEELGWLAGVHRMAKVAGASKKGLPTPEPLTGDEVDTFLAASPSPTHRALFATQIGQGLRPGEVIKVRWEDVDWSSNMLRVRGTKNDLAAAAVPMTPLTRRELSRLWEAVGRPTTGRALPLRSVKGNQKSFLRESAPLSNRYPRMAFPHERRAERAQQDPSASAVPVHLPTLVRDHRRPARHRPGAREEPHATQ